MFCQNLRCRETTLLFPAEQHLLFPAEQTNFPYKGDNLYSRLFKTNNMAVAPAGHGAQGRFGSSTDEDISKILDENDALGTKKATKSSLMCLQQYIIETNNDINFDNYSTQELSSLLVNFYADARKKNGEKYKLSALKSIRFGLARHFSSEHNIDIIKDPAFRKANEVFQAVSVGLKRIGLAKVDHTPPIEENELKQIYYSSALTKKTPECLQLKVWFDIMYFLCRRGRENLRTMNKETFRIAKDNKNREYVYQHVDKLDKNHRENTDPNQSGTDGRMYSVPGKAKFQKTSCNLYTMNRFRNSTSVHVNLQRPHKMHFYQLITSGSITFPQMGIFYHILVIKLVYNKVCQFAYRTKVCGFLRVHRFPPPIKLTVTKLPIGRRK
jgi:hypothetical protein